MKWNIFCLFTNKILATYSNEKTLNTIDLEKCYALPVLDVAECFNILNMMGIDLHFVRRVTDKVINDFIKNKFSFNVLLTNELNGFSCSQGCFYVSLLTVRGVLKTL